MAANSRYYKPALKLSLHIAVLAVLLFGAATCFAQKTAGSRRYAGSRVCQGCHERQYELQSRSAHAASLSSAARHSLASAFPDDFTAYRAPDYRLQWKRHPDGFRVGVFDGKQTLEKAVEWAFGAGHQAVTFVSQMDEDRYVEHHLSYYSAAGSLAPTPGHRNMRAGSAEEAFGVLYTTFDPESAILRCFQCHSTGPLSLGAGLRIQPAEPGVRCEACHGPGGRHAKAASRETIFNPKQLNAAAMNNFCGRCHRPPASDPSAIDWRDPWNVRHQPVFLSQSLCFLKSGGALTCLTCHDAHAPLRRNDNAWYNTRCGACHDARSRPPAAVCTSAANVACASCHMPKVKPQPNLQFTNHWIGVFRDGAVLRPRALLR